MADNLFGLSVPQLRRWGAPWPVDHRQLNEPVDVLNDMIRGLRGPRQVMPSVPGTGAVSAGSITQQFRLKQSGDGFADHLRCRTWDGETEGDEDIFIAKPWMLRRIPFDHQTRAGITYDYIGNASRWATRVSDNEREVQLIIPTYHIADVIFATASIIGGTGIIVGSYRTWLDENRDGRAWARKHDQ